MSDVAQTTSDSIVGLERTRLRLDQQVHKLQESLLHWQTWEAEYEGFKEEIQALGDDHIKAELVHEHQPLITHFLLGKLIAISIKLGQRLKGLC